MTAMTYTLVIAGPMDSALQAVDQRFGVWYAIKTIIDAAMDATIVRMSPYGDVQPYATDATLNAWLGESKAYGTRQAGDLIWWGKR